MEVYKSLSCDAYTFELSGNYLKVETDGTRKFSINYPVSSDCIWYRCYVGMENQVSEELSYEKIKEILQSNRELNEEGFYTCENNLGIKVKNNEIIAKSYNKIAIPTNYFVKRILD